MDVFACRSEEDFYTALATAILKQTASRWEEWIKNAQEFLSRISPQITLGADPTTEMSLSFNLRGQDQAPDDVLQLPEKIARKHHCRIVVCIDEFQQIGEFSDSLTFQKKLRTVWQHQERVTYCLFGSKKHVMDKLFGEKSYPFYKFGDLIYLSKISTPDWVRYIKERFEATGKEISAELAEQIALAVDNHSSYVQQLAWLVWERTEKTTTQQEIDTAIQEIIIQNTPLFEKQIEDLTGYQLSFLQAIVDGIHSSFTSQQIIEKYGLGTSSNVHAIRTALQKKELIDNVEGRVVLTDPVLELWLRQYIFGGNR